MDFYKDSFTFYNLKKKMLAMTAKGPNFDEIKSGGLHENHLVATWN
jgi:hypothetical protein